MIPYCYHTHTKRCGHADGEDEEYVLEAIAAGARHLGFSDHAMFPNLSQPTTRGEYEELPGYVSSIRELKEKYKEKIHIYVGMEAEYFPPYVDYLRKLLEEKTIDYLVLGEHSDWVNGRVGTSFFKVADAMMLRRYVEMCRKALETGLYSIFAHPDICFIDYPKWDKHCVKAAKELCEMALANHVPLEINLGGIRQGIHEKNGERGYLYPNVHFWKIASKYQVPTVIGVDAHTPSHFKTNEFSMALEFARKLQVCLVKDFKLETKE